MSNRQLTEISAVTRLIDNGTRLAFRFVHLIRSRVFRQRDQDVAQVQLSAGVVLVTHLLRQGFDFLRQNGDATTHLVVTHFRDNHLFADLVTIGVVVQTIVSQTAAHLIQRHVVLFRDVSNRLIQLLIGDFHSHFLPHLQDDLIHDQTFHDLVAQRRVIRKLLPCLSSVQFYRLH